MVGAGVHPARGRDGWSWHRSPSLSSSAPSCGCLRPDPLSSLPTQPAFSSVLSLFAWSRATSVLALGPQVKARPDASLAPTCNGFAVARGRAQTLDTMKHLLHCLPPTGVLAFAILLLVACVEQFDAVATNHRSDAVVIGIAQYHSERFDGTPPRSFPAGLLIQQGEVTLGPGERRTLVFDSASGGFWLRWQQLAPTPEPGTWVTIDIGRHARTSAVQ